MSDFSQDPQPDNPFSSPQSETFSAPVLPQAGAGVVCDGTCMGALKMGWELMASCFWPFLGYTLVCIIVRAPADQLDNFVSPSDQETAIGLWLFSQVYSIFVAAPVSMGLSWVFLKAARYEPFTLNDIFGAFARNYLNAVGAGFLKGILVVIGLFLFIVPGLYLLVKLAFVEYLIVDRKMGAIEAMKESWRITDGREWTLFGLMGMSILIGIAGFLLCLIGIVPAIIWLNAAYAVLYHTYCLSEPSEVPEPKINSDNPFSG